MRPSPHCAGRSLCPFWVHAALAADFLAISLFVLLSWAVRRDATLLFDYRVLQIVLTNMPAQLAPLVEQGSVLAETTLLIVPLLLVAALLQRRTRLAMLVLLSGLGAYTLNIASKALIGRPAPGARMPTPITTHTTYTRLTDPLDFWYSYPSGHVLAATVVFGLLAYLLGRGWPLWSRAALWLLTIMIIAYVGISRIYLLRHYPTDVLGGFLLGGAWLLLSILMIRCAG